MQRGLLVLQLKQFIVNVQLFMSIVFRLGPHDANRLTIV